MNTLNSKAKTFSIVIAVHDQAQQLEQNLPILLNQQYDGGYEVIVIDESSSDETGDVLKRMKADHSHLYTTFLPKYQFQKNRRRLALTIGVKAAKCDWVIFTNISTPPPSEAWLQELSASATSPSELLLGYFNRKNGSMRLRCYDNLEKPSRLVSMAERWRAGTGRCRWMRHFIKGVNYNFIAVPKSLGHETLRLFATGNWSLPKKNR